ncbi:TlpA family protein disulfide reductase [Planctomycetota bacterium]
MKVKKLAVCLVVMLLCGVCLGKGLTGKSAPEVRVRKWLTVNDPDLSEMKGRVRVLEFWATWCRSCVKNIPHMNELNNKYKGKGLEIIGLSADRKEEDVVEVIREKGINYAIGLDNGTSDWYGITGYPTVFVVDHRGVVIWQGYPWDKKFEKEIRKALAACPVPYLAGVDLGSFGRYKDALRGGKDFVEAYGQIKSKIGTDNGTKVSLSAELIIETFDRGLLQEIAKADKLSITDPLAAYRIYADIVGKYGGIDAVGRARSSYLELRKYVESKNLVAFAKIDE